MHRQRWLRRHQITMHSLYVETHPALWNAPSDRDVMDALTNLMYAMGRAGLSGRVLVWPEGRGDGMEPPVRHYQEPYYLAEIAAQRRSGGYADIAWAAWPAARRDGVRRRQYTDVEWAAWWAAQWDGVGWWTWKPQGERWTKADWEAWECAAAWKEFVFDDLPL